MALCKDCCARNGEDACLIGQTSVMLPIGSLGCALKESGVEQRMGISKPLTNADRIRSKSDKELAKWFATLTANTMYLTQECMGVKPTIALEWGTTAREWLEWLRKEADNGNPQD